MLNVPTVTLCWPMNVVPSIVFTSQKRQINHFKLRTSNYIWTNINYMQLLHAATGLLIQEGRGGSRNSHDAGGVVMWRDLHSVVAWCPKAEGWRGRRGECGGTTWRGGDLHGVVARCPKAAGRRGVLAWRGETRRQDLRGLNGVAWLRDLWHGPPSGSERGLCPPTHFRASRLRVDEAGMKRGGLVPVSTRVCASCLCISKGWCKEGGGCKPSCRAPRLRVDEEGRELGRLRMRVLFARRQRRERDGKGVVPLLFFSALGGPDTGPRSTVRNWMGRPVATVFTTHK